MTVLKISENVHIEISFGFIPSIAATFFGFQTVQSKVVKSKFCFVIAFIILALLFEQSGNARRSVVHNEKRSVVGSNSLSLSFFLRFSVVFSY